jgi:glycosyltransferase involved in cell wall biosynthesis
MRICYIAHGKFPHVVAYIEHFKQAGHDVHFVALSAGPDRGVVMHRVDPLAGWLKGEGKWRYLLGMWRARRLLKRLKPDVVHAHYATSAGLAAYVCGVHPYVVTGHGTDIATGVRSRIWRPLLQRILTHADCVNPVSDELRDLVLDLGVPSEKVDTFTLGIDTSRFRPGHAAPREPGAPLRLICTRHLEEVYDHRTLLRGLGLLARQGFDFKASLLGEGTLAPALKALAVEEGIAGRTEFLGMVPNQRLPEMLASNDVYLSASSRDGTSLSLLEALASGLYPVVSDITANQVWIKNEDNGLLHEVGNPEQLTEGLARIFRGQIDLEAAKQRNREMVLAKGDRVKNMERLQQIYDRLAAGTRRVQLGDEFRS